MSDRARVYVDSHVLIYAVEGTPREPEVEERSKRLLAILPNKPGPTEDKRSFLPDAIHVVTAIEAGATHFAASDLRIRLPSTMGRLDPHTASFDDLLASM